MQKIVLHRPPRGPVGVNALLPSARFVTFFRLVSGAIGILKANWDDPRAWRPYDANSGYRCALMNHDVIHPIQKLPVVLLPKSESTVGLQIGSNELDQRRTSCLDCSNSQRWFFSVLAISGVSGKAKFSKGSAYCAGRRMGIRAVQTLEKRLTGVGTSAPVIRSGGASR